MSTGFFISHFSFVNHLLLQKNIKKSDMSLTKKHLKLMIFLSNPENYWFNDYK
jgi:hypothetical protein